MPVPFKGTINGEVLSEVYSLPFRIKTAKIANLNAGSTILNYTVVDAEATEIYLAPQNLELSEGDMLQDSTSEVMPSGSQIKVSSNAEVSYYITIENIIPE